MPGMRFNHMELTFPRGTLEPAFRKEVADFYNQQLPQNSWVQVRNIPGLQEGQGFYTSGFDHSTTHLTIGAIDATKFGGTGTIVYTAKGTK